MKGQNSTRIAEVNMTFNELFETHGYVEYHLTCHQCSLGVVANNKEELEEAFHKHGFVVRDGCILCEKHAPRQGEEFRQMHHPEVRPVPLQPWYYNTHEVVTRIPNLVGEVWMNFYSYRLTKGWAIPASTGADGSHMGKGFGPEVMLAKDENGDFLLIRPKK